MCIFLNTVLASNEMIQAMALLNCFIIIFIYLFLALVVFSDKTPKTALKYLCIVITALAIFVGLLLSIIYAINGNLESQEKEEEIYTTDDWEYWLVNAGFPTFFGLCALTIYVSMYRCSKKERMDSLLALMYWLFHASALLCITVGLICIEPVPGDICCFFLFCHIFSIYCICFDMCDDFFFHTFFFWCDLIF